MCWCALKALFNALLCGWTWLRVGVHQGDKLLTDLSNVFHVNKLLKS